MAYDKSVKMEIIRKFNNADNILGNPMNLDNDIWYINSMWHDTSFLPYLSFDTKNVDPMLYFGEMPCIQHGDDILQWWNNKTQEWTISLSVVNNYSEIFSININENYCFRLACNTRNGETAFGVWDKNINNFTGYTLFTFGIREHYYSDVTSYFNIAMVLCTKGDVEYLMIYTLVDRESEYTYNDTKYWNQWMGYTIQIPSTTTVGKEIIDAIRETGFESEVANEGDGDMDDNGNNIIPPDYKDVATDDGTSDSGTTEMHTPTLSASASGFITVYAPTSSQLRALSVKMWSTDFFDNIIKLYQQPMDNIISLSIVPVTPTTKSASIVIGNYQTGVSSGKVTNQYVTVDCGTISILPTAPKCYLDFAPYTKCDLYLPYVGIVPVDVDKIMCKTLNVKYQVDVLTGDFLCYVYIIDSDGCDKLCGSYSGNCATQIPITSANFGRIYQACINSATALGISGASLATCGLGTHTNAQILNKATDFGKTITNSVGDIANQKPSFAQSGNLSATSGAFGNQKPFFVMQRPYKVTGNIQSKLGGYASNTTAQIKELSGFFQCESFYATYNKDYAQPTQEEIDEIETMLKGGCFTNGM